MCKSWTEQGFEDISKRPTYLQGEILCRANIADALQGHINEEEKEKGGGECRI